MADDDVLLEKIANHYLFYGSFHSDLGLYNGKMGMVIFFFFIMHDIPEIVYTKILLKSF